MSNRFNLLSFRLYALIYRLVHDVIKHVLIIIPNKGAIMKSGAVWQHSYYFFVSKIIT